MRLTTVSSLPHPNPNLTRPRNLFDLIVVVLGLAWQACPVTNPDPHPQAYRLTLIRPLFLPRFLPPTPNPNPYTYPYPYP